MNILRKRYYFVLCFIIFSLLIVSNIYKIGNGSFKSGSFNLSNKIGYQLLINKHYALSKLFYNFSLKLHENDAVAYWGLANNALYKAKSMDYNWNERKQLFIQAIEYYNKVLVIYPRSVDTLNYLADCYINIEENENAIKVSEEVIKLDKTNTYAYSNLADLYTYENEDYEKALYYIDLYLKYKNSNDIAPYYKKAWILGLFKTEEKDLEAIKYYEKYLSLNPQNRVAPLVNIAGLSLRVKRYDDAIRYAEEGRIYNHNSGYLIGHLASAYIGKRDYQKAKEYVNELLTQDKNCYYAHWKLAKIALFEGNKAEAEKHFDISKHSAQDYIDNHCQPQKYNLYDLDGNCINRKRFLREFDDIKYDERVIYW